VHPTTIATDAEVVVLLALVMVGPSGKETLPEVAPDHDVSRWTKACKQVDGL